MQPNNIGTLGKYEQVIRIMDLYVCFCSLWPSFSLMLIVNLISGVSRSSPIILCLKALVHVHVCQFLSVIPCVHVSPMFPTLDSGGKSTENVY